MAQSRPQARVYIRDEILERGEELLAITKLGSLTELIAVMFSRYSSHLAATWEVVPIPNSQFSAAPEPQPMSTPATATVDFTFEEPLTGL